MNPRDLLPRPGSLRWRLTLLYVVLLALVLLTVSAVQDIQLWTSLIHGQAQTFSSDVDAARAAFQRVRAQPSDISLAKRYAAITTAVAGKDVIVSFYSHRLVYLAETGAASEASTPQLTTAQLKQALVAGSSGPFVVSVGDASYVVMAFATTPNAPATSAVAVLATSMQAINSVVSRMLLLQLLTGVIAIVAVLVAGLVLSQRAMRPMQRLQATATELAHGNLSARSQLPHRNDEVGDLGRSFDEMADRIEAAFQARAASEERVRRFIADASHELRTPVTSIKGFIDVMQRGAGRDPQSLEAILPAMARETERLRVLVLDLLTLARLDADRPQVLRPVAVNAVVGRVLDEGAPGMPTAVTRNLAEPDPIVLADSDSLVTVLRNLLINACKYAPGAAQHWSTRRSPGEVQIIVADEGPGISATDLPHIFERFYRGEKTRTREEGGSGLGLSIVSGLVEAMHGRVEMASTEGEGTTITIGLPEAGSSEVEG